MIMIKVLSTALLIEGTVNTETNIQNVTQACLESQLVEADRLVIPGLG